MIDRFLDAVRKYSHKYDDCWFDEDKSEYVVSESDPEDGVHVENGGRAMRVQIDRIERNLRTLRGDG